MSNHKISITAEFASLIKSRDNENYKYYVSNKTRIIYNILTTIFSKISIENIFHHRLLLSNEFDEFIKNDNLGNDSFNTIVEFGCGYSLRGFEYSLINKDKLYVDTDFKDVIEKKRHMLNTICADHSITFPDNYILLDIDVLKDDIYEKLKDYVKHKSLFLAEGLTPYFSIKEYLIFIDKIKPLLKKSKNTFFSQENFLRRQSFTYIILRKFLVIVTNNKSYIKFKTKEDLVRFLNEQGLIKNQVYYKDNNLFYIINS